MAYWWVADNLQMVDASLEYYDPFVVVDGVTPLSSPGGGMSIWADSEHNAPLPAKCVSLEYFLSNGTAASASPEVHLIPNGKLLPSKATTDWQREVCSASGSHWRRAYGAALSLGP